MAGLAQTLVGAPPVAIATLVVCLAVLTRQAAMAYRQSWRISFSLFLILFLGTTVFDVFIPTGDVVAFLAIDSYLAKLVVIFLASMFFGGVLVFWAKRMLYLLPVIAGASLVTIFTPLLIPGASQSHGIHLLLLVAAGIAGGLWLYWWRDCRRKRETPANGKGNKTGAAGLNTGSGCSN